jgi:hypothetical protein
MKNLILSLFMMAGGLVLGQVDSNSLAVVDKIDGYCIFIYSQPVSKYEVLGEAKSYATPYNGLNERMNRIIKTTIKNTPRLTASL